MEDNNPKTILNRIYTFASVRNLAMIGGVLLLVVIATIVNSHLKDRRLNLSPSSYIRISETLSSEQIKKFLETSDGYMWIGTESGLNRFDGNSYMQFFANNDSMSLVNNNIYNLVELQNHPGHLVVTTMTGVAIYYPSGEFIPIEPQEHMVVREIGSDSLIANSPHQVFLMKLDYRQKKVQQLRELTFSSRVLSVFPAASNRFWVMVGTDLLLYDDRFTQLQKVSLPSLPLREIVDKEFSWILLDDGYYDFNLETGTLSQTPLTQFVNARINPRSVTKNFHNHGMLAVKESGTRSVRIFDLVNLTLQEEDFPEFYDSELGEVYQDSDGNIWAGSRGFGVKVLYARHQLFSNNNALCTFFDKKEITSLCPGLNGDIWVVIGRSQLYRCTSDGTILPIHLKFAEGTSIYHICCSPRGHIYLCAEQKLYDCVVSNDELVPVSTYLTDVQVLGCDQQGTIWVGSMSGTAYIDTEANKLCPVNLGLRNVYVIEPLRDGRILFSSNDGELCLYHPQSNARQQFHMPPIRKGLIACRAVAQDRHDDIWIASMGAGIFRFNPDTGEFTNYQPVGLNSDIICMVADPYDDALWLGTMRGLSCFDLKSGHVQTYLEKDGVRGNEFFNKCAILMSDSTIVLGGKKGITAFDSRSIKPETSSRLILSNVSVEHRLLPPGPNPIAPDGLGDGATLHLPNNNSSIQFYLSTLDFGAYVQSIMLYRMEDVDTHWNYASRQTALYTHLNSGKHRFEARIIDPSGATICDYHLMIKVENPWWKEPWMLWFCWPLLLLVTVGAIVRSRYDVIMSRRRVKRSLREKVALKHVSDMNMRFFTNISHEFRTPLTLIKGATDMMRDQLGNAPMQDAEDRQLFNRSFSIIQNNTNRMMRLVNQLLDFNKLEHDMLKLRVQQQAFGIAVNPLIEMFESKFSDKSLHLLTHLDDLDIRLWLDSDKFEKIFINLISNAIKFTPHDGTVTLTTRRITADQAAGMFDIPAKEQCSAWMLTQVADTGIGIPEGQLEAIFERYYQTEQGLAQVNGTGIGLCYSKGLVRLHHGFIKAENGDKQGAVFSFILPLDDIYSEDEKIRFANVDAAPDGKESKAESLPAGEDEDIEPGTRPVILIVDDDTDMLQYVQMVMGNHFHIVTETSAIEALSSLPSIKPNLIISDVMMLGIDGFKFCKLIKNDPSYCHIPVILLTAKESIDDHIIGLNAGADAYVTKPFDADYLRALVESLLTNRHKIQKMLSASTTLTDEQSSSLQNSDSLMMQRMYEYMGQHMSETELNLNEVLDVTGMSRSKLFYKIKELTGMSPNALFKCYKLNKAAEMILSGQDKIAYIAAITGFAGPSHFSTSFKKQFGVTPSEYKAASTP